MLKRDWMVGDGSKVKTIKQALSSCKASSAVNLIVRSGKSCFVKLFNLHQGHPTAIVILHTKEVDGDDDDDGNGNCN